MNPDKFPKLDLPENPDDWTDAQWDAFERTTLMAPDREAEIIQDCSAYIRGDTVENGIVMPRYGLLTFRARRAPCYCYGHPEIKAKFPHGFNDGRHIFVSDDFVRELSAQEDASGGTKEGLIPYLLKHLTHMVMNHNRRLDRFHPEIAQMGADLWARAKLKLAYPDMDWVPLLEETIPGAGATPAQLIEIAKRAEESLAAELALKYGKFKSDPNAEIEEIQEPAPKSGKSKPQPGKKPNDKPGDKPGDKSGDKPGDGDGDGDGDGGADKAALEKALKEMGVKNAASAAQSSGSQMQNMQETSQMAEALGLSATAERLGLPDADAAEEFEKLEKNIRLDDISDITKSLRLPGQKGTMGGGHLADAAHEEAMKEGEGKLSWKLGLQEVLGESMRYIYSEDEPSDLWHVPPSDMGVSDPIYVGTDLPSATEGAVMVLMDTSGSITEDLFKTFLAEVFGIMRSQNPESDKASEVILIFCDDVLRGQPVLIDEGNVDELLEKKMLLAGRGGNDIGGTIRAAAKLDIFKEKKVNSMVYLTDLGDQPPVKSDVPEGLPLAFVCPPEYWHEDFGRAVKDFARVWPIEEGLQVDLTKEGWKNADPSALAKSAPRKNRWGM